jgi:hypothetical protein
MVQPLGHLKFRFNTQIGMARKNSATGVIDRRSFVRAATLLAAGSALPSSFLGCSDIITTYIPCLGPADPPTPVAGMTYIKASEIGCALDCDLATGRNKKTGGAATDDGPRINAAMAGATAANPITLIIDGSALVSGLFLPAGGHWAIAGLGCGTGFFIKSGTNNDGIHNGNPNAATPSDPGPPAPPRGMNVSLSNFSLNGNQGNGHNGVSTTGKHQGTSTVWYFGINLMNLDNITIQNVVAVNTPAYLIRLSNVGNVNITGCVLMNSGVNTDGLHFDGPANDISISDCSFTVPGDDSIALNCPEGYGGNISRVRISDCTFNDAFTILRLYTAGSSGKFYVDTVQVSNCNGTLEECAFVIGLFGGSNPNSVTGLTVTDCKLTAPAVVAVSENFGTITLSNVSFTPAKLNTWWDPGEKNHIPAFLRPSPSIPYLTCIGSSLTLQNCTVVAAPDIQAVAVLLEASSTIANLEFDGFSVAGTASSFQMPELLNLESGSIGNLVLNSLNATGVQAPLTSGQFPSIGSISGSGVLATGWKFPDSVMANKVPYISASTGSPTIKVGGIIESYHP